MSSISVEGRNYFHNKGFLNFSQYQIFKTFSCSFLANKYFLSKLNIRSLIFTFPDTADTAFHPIFSASHISTIFCWQAVSSSLMCDNSSVSSQVINSATNFFLYCWVARRFRVELKIWLRSVIGNLGRICSNQTS